MAGNQILRAIHQSSHALFCSSSLSCFSCSRNEISYMGFSCDQALMLSDNIDYPKVVTGWKKKSYLKGRIFSISHLPVNKTHKPSLHPKFHLLQKHFCKFLKQLFQEEGNQASHSFNSQNILLHLQKKIPSKSKYELKVDLYAGTLIKIHAVPMQGRVRLS